MNAVDVYNYLYSLKKPATAKDVMQAFDIKHVQGASFFLSQLVQAEAAECVNADIARGTIPKVYEARVLYGDTIKTAILVYLRIANRFGVHCRSIARAVNIEQSEATRHLEELLKLDAVDYRKTDHRGKRWIACYTETWSPADDA